MITDLPATHITDFNGLFAQGPAESVPINRFRTAQNIRYLNGGFETRYGTSVSISFPNGVQRFFPYNIEGQANRIIYLDLVGNLYDSLFPGSPILSIPEMIDFSMVVFNDRAYISPHNRVRGLPGQFVYLYVGDGNSARLAGGNNPTGFSLQVSQSSQAGNIEAGTHLFAIAYETNSGFITRPGPELLAVYVAPEVTNPDGSISRFKAHISNIGVGPTGTIARHILATKIIPNYTGDQQGPELFFVPFGKIEDDFTTAIDVDFFDQDLQKSADYLRDQMATIPAVLGLASFGGSLVGWGSNTEPSTVYVSKAGEPESVSLIDGGIEVDLSAGGGVKNCVEYRKTLMIHKRNSTYAIQNNGNEPSEWGQPEKVDSAVGSEVFGIAAIYDDEGNTVDRYIVAARRGLLAYNGTFDLNLTIAIDDIWKRITKTAFNTVQCVLDPENQFIAVAVPLDGQTSPNTILYGDFQKGLDPDNIRWATWTFPYSPSSVGIDVDALGLPVLKIASRNGNIYLYDSTMLSDNFIAIPNPTFQTGFIGSEEAAVTLFGGVRFRGVGDGNLNLEITGLDENVQKNPPSLFLSATPGRLLDREFELQSQYASIKGWTSNINEKFKITRISMYSSPFWMEEPA